jgi:Kef-type K+ transport system membrane component KefB
MTHPNSRVKLGAVGYGLLVPVFVVFFASSGLRSDLDALTLNPSAFLRVPVFLAALLAARGVSALLSRRALGADGSVVAALVQATALPLVLTAVPSNNAAAEPVLELRVHRPMGTQD